MGRGAWARRGHHYAFPIHRYSWHHHARRKRESVGDVNGNPSERRRRRGRRPQRRGAVTRRALRTRSRRKVLGNGADRHAHDQESDDVRVQYVAAGLGATGSVSRGPRRRDLSPGLPRPEEPLAAAEDPHVGSAADVHRIRRWV